MNARSVRWQVLKHRDQIHRLCATHNVERIRLFGSVLHGSEQASNDVDFLVQFQANARPFDHTDLKQELTDLLGMKADIVTEDGIHWTIRDRVMAEACLLDELESESRPSPAGPKKDERLYLYVMLEHVGSIEEYTQIGRDGVFASELTSDALIWCVHKIGLTMGSWSKLDPTACPESVHKHFVKTAHALIEQYWDIDQDNLWRVVSEDVPLLKEIILDKLRGLGEDPFAVLSAHSRRSPFRNRPDAQETHL